jgi:predicted RNA-binding protein YlqC (UPF0109 family)
MLKKIEIDYIRSIIEPLVANEFEVDKLIDDRGVLLTVKLAPSDIGKIIGKNGETAKAIRRLIRQYGMANDQHISVKIYEPNKDIENK